MTLFAQEDSPMKRFTLTIAAVLLAITGAACAPAADEVPASSPSTLAATRTVLDKYASVRIEADLSPLTDAQRRIVELLIEASEPVNEIFWQQAYGDPTELLAAAGHPDTERLIRMNFGPWDRLGDFAPFIEGVGPRPLGGNLYPADATREEIESASPEHRSLYTVVRRNSAGELIAVPYHEAFADQVQVMSAKLREAAQLAEDGGLESYLELRAEALLNDDYQASDLAWMDMKNNTIEIVIGPIETYEDQLLGAKAGYEAYVLIKDKAWSVRLARYAALLPGLQRSLPVGEAYKREVPGTDAELNAYDLVYVAGDGNHGSKTIAINLPNDEEVQLAKGTRRIQIKNIMRAKFDAILEPIADALLAEDQRPHVTFDAFFANTMFHEVAHGLGIKNTVNGAETVRQALREQASWLEEGKADVLGLHMITELHVEGELPDTDLMDNYVTFFASMFRSIRFSLASSHGRANLVRFNFFREAGAFTHDAESGTYRIEFERMQEVTRDLSAKILQLQGDGDHAGVAAFHDDAAVIGAQLQADLDALAGAGIPVDLVYEQGKEVLGL